MFKKQQQLKILKSMKVTKVYLFLFPPLLFPPHALKQRKE